MTLKRKESALLHRLPARHESNPASKARKKLNRKGLGTLAERMGCIPTFLLTGSEA
jgi:hypothetical protein